MTEEEEKKQEYRKVRDKHTDQDEAKRDNMKAIKKKTKKAKKYNKRKNITKDD